MRYQWESKNMCIIQILSSFSGFCHEEAKVQYDFYKSIPFCTLELCRISNYSTKKPLCNMPWQHRSQAHPSKPFWGKMLCVAAAKSPVCQKDNLPY